MFVRCNECIIKDELSGEEGNSKNVAMVLDTLLATLPSIARLYNSESSVLLITPFSCIIIPRPEVNADLALALV
jgi:hypothetical protein